MSAQFSSSAAPEVEVSPTFIVGKDSSDVCRSNAPLAVGGILPAEALRSIEDELDRAIAELDQQCVLAMQAGDRGRAREMADRFYAAIRSRIPEHVQRLEAERLAAVERSLDNEEQKWN